MRQLAVGLQPEQPVDDVAAGRSSSPGPGDVGLLVEPGLDLHQGQHLLAGLGRLDQGVDDRGVAGGAVEGLLDRQHLRVLGRLLDEPLHAGGEGVVRVVQQHVALLQRGEHVGRLARSRPRPAGGGWRAGRPGTSARPGRGRPARTARAGPAARAGGTPPRSLMSSSLTSSSSILGSMSSSTSSRTGGRPTRRRSSSFSRASSRFSASSSSTSTSSLRVTRKVWCSTICMPREQLVEVPGDHVLQGDEPALGQLRRTGAARVGTLTRANWRSPVSGLRTSTARLIDSPEM